MNGDIIISLQKYYKILKYANIITQKFLFFFFSLNIIHFVSTIATTRLRTFYVCLPKDNHNIPQG